MTALPAATDFTGATRTEAQVKTALNNQRAFLAELLGTAGTRAEALATLGGLLGAGVSAKIGAYTVAATDRGKVINCTSGTFTLSSIAAATLGGGFAFGVRNSGSGVITYNPNGSELVDGVTSIDLLAGESCLVVCNGTAFVTFGRKPALKTINGASIEGSGNLIVAEPDVTYTDIRSIMLCKCTTVVLAGGTVSGASLFPASSVNASATPLTGTWRARCNVASLPLGGWVTGVFERIA